MPIIRIEALTASEPDVAGLLREASRAVAQAFDVPEKQCWSLWRPIAPGTYHEGARLRGVDDAAEVSPLVTVSLYRGRSAEQKAAALKGLDAAVGQALGSDPDNVFVELHEIGVSEIGQCAEFLLQSVDRCGLDLEQGLERHVDPPFPVVGPVDGSHATGTEPLTELVAPLQGVTDVHLSRSVPGNADPHRPAQNRIIEEPNGQGLPMIPWHLPFAPDPNPAIEGRP